MSYLRKSLILSVILINFFWLAQLQWSFLKKTTMTPPHQSQFNALFKEVHWSEYDVDGMITHRFYAPTVKNISNQINIIYSPNIELHNQKESWVIKAMYAKTIEGYDKIELHHDVVIKHTDFKKNPPSLLSTEKLTYLPKTQQAFTDKKVTFNQGENIIYSQGMQADFAHSGHVKLGQVEGTYHPDKAPPIG